MLLMSPFKIMTERLLSGDPASFFPIHRAGRLKEWTHAEKLAHMDTLPGAHGFKIMFLPVKIKRATGAWTRAVAIQDEWLASRDVELIDLSLPLMNASFESESSRVQTRHRDQMRRLRAKVLGIKVEQLPHAGSMDLVDAPSNAGTHVRAPYAFGAGNGRRALTIDEVPLDWFYGDGVLLDFSRGKRPGDTLTLADVRGELERVGHTLASGDIVLIRTGAADAFEDDPAFPELGMALEREAASWLLDQGVRTIGCDAESCSGSPPSSTPGISSTARAPAAPASASTWPRASTSMCFSCLRCR